MAGSATFCLIEEVSAGKQQRSLEACDMRSREVSIICSHCANSYYQSVPHLAYDTYALLGIPERANFLPTKTVTTFGVRWSSHHNQPTNHPRATREGSTRLPPRTPERGETMISDRATLTPRRTEHGLTNGIQASERP